jgi:two-component system sensor kinase FixL
VNLNTLIKETVDIIQPDSIKQSIKININLENDPVIVFGDKIQLQLVLMNFIRNTWTALEKCDPGKRTLDISLKLDMELAIVSVRDSGPGIDEAIKGKLFKPFVTTSKEGFGIGLTLCRSIIEKHNGQIWASSESEGDTVFSFSLKSVKNESDE